MNGIIHFCSCVTLVKIKSATFICPLSALAHEVLNPLATINLAVQILKSPTEVLDHKLYLDIIKAGGMGLGLSTTMNILNSNHAMAEVESEEGKGTRFILSFGRVEQSGE